MGKVQMWGIDFWGEPYDNKHANFPVSGRAVFVQKNVDETDIHSFQRRKIVYAIVNMFVFDQNTSVKRP